MVTVFQEASLFAVMGVKAFENLAFFECVPKTATILKVFMQRFP